MMSAAGSYKTTIAKDEAKEKVRQQRDAVEAKTMEAKEKADELAGTIVAQAMQLDDLLNKVKKVKTAK